MITSITGTKKKKTSAAVPELGRNVEENIVNPINVVVAPAPPTVEAAVFVDASRPDPKGVEEEEKSQDVSDIIANPVAPTPTVDMNKVDLDQVFFYIDSIKELDTKTKEYVKQSLDNYFAVPDIGAIVPFYEDVLNNDSIDKEMKDRLMKVVTYMVLSKAQDSENPEAPKGSELTGIYEELYKDVSSIKKFTDVVELVDYSRSENVKIEEFIKNRMMGSEGSAPEMSDAESVSSFFKYSSSLSEENVSVAGTESSEESKIFKGTSEAAFARFARGGLGMERGEKLSDYRTRVGLPRPKPKIVTMGDISEPDLGMMEESTIDGFESVTESSTQVDTQQSNTSVQDDQVVGQNVQFSGTGAQYHKIPITLFFGSADTPNWDLKLNNDIDSLNLGSDDCNAIMDGIISVSGPKILVYKRMSSTVQETKELLQLHFCLERKMAQGPRQPMANVPLKQLFNMYSSVSAPGAQPDPEQMLVEEGERVASGELEPAVPPSVEMPKNIAPLTPDEYERMWDNRKYNENGPSKPKEYYDVVRSFRPSIEQPKIGPGDMSDPVGLRVPNIYTIKFSEPDPCDD